jgi:hypothetical protein
MQWVDPYSKLYQIANGFPVTILSNPENKKAYLSMKPTTRAAYDMSMRENSIDGIITMKDKFDLKAGNMFYLDEEPTGIYILQSCCLWEQQPDSRNVNAIKTNCFIDIQRYGYKDETSEIEEWYNVHENVRANISETLSDSKNFNAGFEVTTYKIVQIPRFDIDNNFYDVQENDRVVVTNLANLELNAKIQIESLDNFGIDGIIRIQGTQDMRNN